jgi:transposase InsO family protein
MQRNDVETLTKLGLHRYIEGMTITRIMPKLPILVDLSKEAKQRLKWMDYYAKCRNVSQTCRYYGISRKTFHKWHALYRPHDLTALVDRSRRPDHVRRWEVTREEERRVLSLRTRHIRYGKMKLRVIYLRTYGEPISSWKIQRVIQKHGLYYHPVKNARTQAKRHKGKPKKRITELKKEKRQGFLVAMDTVVRYIAGYKRYILTGIDVYSKIAFARMYPGHGSSSAADFLKRIHYLLEGKIENIQTDNGSEFAKYFRLAAETLHLEHYFSRVRTPKDNTFDERFNRTLEEEFIALGHLTNDCAIFNKEVTEWLIEYNFHRPHQSLGYDTPINFHYQHHKVLPMYPSSTYY